MLLDFDIAYQTSDTITFTTESITDDDYRCYVVYDTSTGYTTLKDYYVWRSNTYTSTGLTDSSAFIINNSSFYPRLTPSITDYTVLNPFLFYIISSLEHFILMNVLDRLDLVRKRLPNPGVVISDVDGFGDNGVASVAGGYYKKFAISELMRYIEGALIEINLHPPATSFYWAFTTADTDKTLNPYQRYTSGVPYNFVDLIIQGAVIRALVSWGILEVDLNFITSDAGLTITYDKVGHVQSWYDRLLTSYTNQMDKTKMNYANHAGIGIGSLPYSATGIFGSAMNMIEHSGTMPLTSMLGFNMRTNIPM
jgi:hypothetical protein